MGKPATHKSVTKVVVEGYEVSLVREFDEQTEAFEEYILARHATGTDRFTQFHPLFPALIRGLSSLIEKSEALVEAVEEVEGRLAAAECV